MRFEVAVNEVRIVARTYVVEASDAMEAKELAERGETTDEWGDDYEVADRLVEDGPGAIKEMEDSHV
jgi:hypothetical protein